MCFFSSIITFYIIKNKNISHCKSEYKPNFISLKQVSIIYFFKLIIYSSILKSAIHSYDDEKKPYYLKSK